MRTTSFVVLLFFLAACSISKSSAQSADPFPPSNVPDRIILTWQEDPAYTQAVSWRTSVAVKKAYAQINLATPSPNVPDTSTVAYTATTQMLVTNNNAAHFHSVNFKNLQPKTQYMYRVGDSTIWSEWFHFQTASANAEPFSFLYFGDAQNALKSLWSRTIRGAYSKMPSADFLLHAGDLVNNPVRDEEWGEWFYAGGWIYGMMPSIATPGNHEYYRNNQGVRQLADHWKPTFTLPENGPTGLEETAYYTDYQGVRIISINSQAFLLSAQDSVSQVAWLEDMLQKNPNRWTIVTMHHPIYSSKFGRDNPTLRNALKPLFEKYNVDLLLQGHDHTYGRGGDNIPFGKEPTLISGPVYVVSVSGPKMYDLSMEEWMKRGASNTQLYQVIQVNGNRLLFEAYTTTDQLYDTFELVKDNEGKNTFRDLTPDNVPELLDLPPGFKKSYTEGDWAKFNQRFKAYKRRKQE